SRAPAARPVEPRLRAPRRVRRRQVRVRRRAELYVDRQVRPDLRADSIELERRARGLRRAQPLRVGFRPHHPRGALSLTGATMSGGAPRDAVPSSVWLTEY